MNIATGQQVAKIATDYTDGRTGTVVEIGTDKNEGRVRVHWTHEARGVAVRNSAGKPTGLKTWCKVGTVRSL